MFCPKCGTQLPDDAAFCIKCGANVGSDQQKQSAAPSSPVIAPFEAKSLKCPNCGGPITPKFGEMIVTCDYCGTGVTLGSDGWRGVQRQTMLPLKLTEQNQVTAEIHGLMDRGLLHRHLQEESTLEELNLSFVPYWIVSVSARTSIVASDMMAQAGEVATTAALAGIIGSGFGGRRGGGLGGPLVAGVLMGGMMGPSRNAARKTYEMNNNYNFPVVALKALTEHQPRNYQFNLEERVLFDVSKIPKGIKILNGDVGEEAAKYQAKTFVDQLQSEEAHAQYHMIQELHSDIDIADTEVLYAPIWFARYMHKGNKIALVIDGNSLNVINSIGL